MSTRIADLLICEHISHEILSQNGFASATSRIIEEEDEEENQIFLEVERFDRSRQGGRKGLISLQALSLEFVGTLNSWSAISTGLVQKKLIQEETHHQIRLLEIFGELIGNSDMHARNLSFFLDENLRIHDLAPIYDMLPMMYYPRQNQIVDRPFQPALPVPEEVFLWKPAYEMASLFWKKASQDTRISAKFRTLSTENQKILDSQKEWVTKSLNS